MKVIDVTPENIERTGFFCLMSRKKSKGYTRKLTWCRRRLSEGMRLRILELPDRGFVETIPGELAWRPVEATGYLFIHCLWVVGKSKGRGYGKALLESCIDDARQSAKQGVAIVTSEKTWLVSKKLLESRGFTEVDSAPPAFSLMALRFDDTYSSPRFSGDWRRKAEAFGNGLTVIRTDQCPYIADAAEKAFATAARAKVKAQEVVLENAVEIRDRSPSAYGTFGLVLDGRLLSYHYLLERDLLPMLNSKKA